MAATEQPRTRDFSEERKWVGKSIRRVEDPKFLRGKGGYIDDMRLPGMVHAALVRSPHAHARIVSVDVEAARRLPGVLAVVTGAEAVELADPLPDFGPAADKHVWRLLAVDKVRYVGEGVVAIVAESRYVAEDAADLVDVEYEPLEPVVDPEAALTPGAPLIHDPLGSNVAYERTFVFGEVDRDFAEADVVVSDRLRWHRSGGQPLETVGAIADYDAGTGMLTIHANSLSFTSYLFMLAGTLKIAPNRLDMHPHPAGGSFGSKLFATKVSAIAGMLSKVTGRPVKYVEDRIDNLSNCDHHGSDRIYDVELALMRDGTMRSLRIKTIDDYGGYIQ
ncbi:MAG: xanthine dehydrogenase family protein molybdopterin-binding subunit, partial [Solirubrobacterales bacterium]|nr:xanthine dehydrogenase family protein molybdopterin-binding subunit [Solirubrobacterales bacterium]